MKKAGKIILAAVMSLVCLFGSVSEAKADSYAGINLGDDEDCTVEVTLVDQDTYNQAEPIYVDGAELSLVKVADLNTDGTYTLLSDFQGLEGWDAYISGDGTAADAGTAAEAAENMVKMQSLTAAVTKTTGSDGKAELSINGSYGIYLLYESGKEADKLAEKYYDINPVLVQMPLLQDGQWVYKQTLDPKMVINSGTSVKVRKRAQQDGKITDTAVLNAKLEIVSADDESQILDQWETTSVDHDSVLLKPGNYILKETQAPDGYGLAAPITFEIKADGTLLIDNEPQSSAEIIMPDPVNTPATPSTPQNSVAQKITNMVKTGDTAQLTLWIVMAAAALCVIVFLIVKMKRKDKE